MGRRVPTYVSHRAESSSSSLFPSPPPHSCPSLHLPPFSQLRWTQTSKEWTDSTFDTGRLFSLWSEQRVGVRLGSELHSTGLCKIAEHLDTATHVFHLCVLFINMFTFIHWNLRLLWISYSGNRTFLAQPFVVFNGSHHIYSIREIAKNTSCNKAHRASRLHHSLGQLMYSGRSRNVLSSAYVLTYSLPLNGLRWYFIFVLTNSHNHFIESLLCS